MRHCLLAVGLLSLFACTEPGRAPGQRNPRSARCDDSDETRCLLPWPSNVYTVRDDATETGLRVSVELSALPQRDSPVPLSRLDGFSVATSLLAGFPSRLAPSLAGQRHSSAVRLFVASGPDFGAEVPVRLHVVDDSTSEAGLLLAYPHHPLAFATDYVVVVLDEVTPAAGGRYATPRAVQLSVGAASAETDDERALVAYHAPLRTLLARAGLAPERVLRAWDFTTRSETSATAPLLAMRAQALAAVDARNLEVVVTDTTSLADGGVAFLGEVRGLPSFVADGGLADAPMGTHAAPFRVALPAERAEPLPVVVFGHGTGGSVEGDALDAELLSTGAARLNIELDGWTRATVPTTFLGFERTLSGSERSTARLAQSLVDASALRAALGAQLGEALGARFDLSRVAWVGSSLGGTVGFTHALQEPGITAAVLNVPGAGCTQFFLHAEQWKQLDEVFAVTTPSRLDRALALSLSQSSWDLIDGASWSARSGQAPKPLLAQESIGDPVVPNLASELVATSAGALQLGHVIEPVDGLRSGAETSGPSLTQYRLPAAWDGDSGALHAFLTKDTPAGAAARAQLVEFLKTTWAGAPRAVVPDACAQHATGCDFH